MIELANLSRVYHTRQGRRAALGGISLCVTKGEKIGVPGRNGTGRFTMIRMISGTEPPSAGEIYHGMSVSWSLVFGGVFQGSLTGMDNLRFIRQVYGSDVKVTEPFVQRFSELGYYLREPVKIHPASIRARLVFAISMVIEFNCLLINEATTMSDSRLHSKCHRGLFEKRRDRSLTTVSHDAGYIREHCDSAAVLVQGRLHTFKQIGGAYAFYQENVG